MPLVKTIIQQQVTEGMSLNINIEFSEFGHFVFRETFAQPDQESILPAEEIMPPGIIMPPASTQGGDRILFCPTMLTFA